MVSEHSSSDHRRSHLPPYNRLNEAKRSRLRHLPSRDGLHRKADHHVQLIRGKVKRFVILYNDCKELKAATHHALVRRAGALRSHNGDNVLEQVQRHTRTCIKKSSRRASFGRCSSNDGSGHFTTKAKHCARGVCLRNEQETTTLTP